MHRSIITIRSNTRRPRAPGQTPLWGIIPDYYFERVAHHPGTAPEGVLPSSLPKARPDLEHATSRAQHSSPILYGYSLSFGNGVICFVAVRRVDHSKSLEYAEYAERDRETVLLPRPRGFFCINFFSSR